ncbi:GNAT family N-acetyltransferase [Enterovibrio sp. ZSDZ35]|uniref:GNAT family N-acetyltransferase n=1 Tax=Enterovibrio qingdaonensis TaxID=2899818 RepID=A0ABT5QR12_9GAMM|nr:GNAT family N-acetyltransferase [Enterovibrio sp. ZSDZ35]MDD1783138.1 GNAT family N-acetyltransferase [Enterovibrio sp. ZSDZ35]
MTKIEAVSPQDLSSIIALVGHVAEHDVVPHFNEQGKDFFRHSVLNDLETTFDTRSFHTFKLTEDDNLLGFCAMREGNYLTHLFIDKPAQGKGYGQQLLNHTFSHASSTEITLRASINAVTFYERYGFKKLGGEEEMNGIRFVKMRYTLKS